MKYILMDVEGTTTSIQFVHSVLFPYSLTRIEPFLKERKAEVAALVASVQATLLKETGSAIAATACASVLKSWVRADRKHPALKEIQGLIWQAGYAAGEIKGHVYDDVPPAWHRWSERGLALGIYSSGSVLAQKQLFAHSLAGDLARMLTHHFDTQVGAKGEAISYQRIAREVRLPPSEILFLSDVGAELAAARESGLQVMQIVREGTVPAAGFEQRADFSRI